MSQLILLCIRVINQASDEWNNFAGSSKPTISAAPHRLGEFAFKIPTLYASLSRNTQAYIVHILHRKKKKNEINIKKSEQQNEWI